MGWGPAPRRGGPGSAAPQQGGHSKTAALGSQEDGPHLEPGSSTGLWASQAPERGEGMSLVSASPVCAVLFRQWEEASSLPPRSPLPPQEKRQQGHNGALRTPVHSSRWQPPSRGRSVTERGDPARRSGARPGRAVASDTRRTTGEPLARGPGKEGHVSLGFPHMQGPPRRQKNPGVVFLGGAGGGESGEALRHGPTVPVPWP